MFDLSEVTPGARLLARFLELRGIRSRALAVAVGVSAVTVHNWLTGRIRPRLEKRLRIAEFTEGAVASSTWLKRAEREAAGLPQWAEVV